MKRSRTWIPVMGIGGVLVLVAGCASLLAPLGEELPDDRRATRSIMVVAETGAAELIVLEMQFALRMGTTSPTYAQGRDRFLNPSRPDEFHLDCVDNCLTICELLPVPWKN